MSTQQNALADSVKKIHQQLRERIQEKPEQAETIWNEHVANLDERNAYADSMRQLAEEHWSEKAYGKTRITWCHQTIREYFYDNGLRRRCARDQRKGMTTESCDECRLRYEEKKFQVRLLDVGSCYNAFSAFDDLETLAIDIAPADDSVHRIDFLRLPQPPLFSTHAFDTIVFCLMLDYLPTCRQRLTACQIAHQLLKCLGLLLIVEPYSSLRDHREKAWRLAFERLGFGLISYVKLINIHCMAFRKLITPMRIDEHEYEEIEKLLNIPQDEKPTRAISTDSHQSSVSIDQDLFNQLPFTDE